MNLRTALIMAILLVAGSAYIYQTEFKKQEISAKDTETVIFAGVEKSSIQKIGISSAKGSIQIEKEGFTPATARGATAFKPREDTEPGWVLFMPPGAPTDAAAVNRLLGAITALKSTTQIDEHEVGDLSDFGLSSPEIILEIEGGFGKRKIFYGKRMQITGRRYLSIDGDKKLYLVDESLYSLLSQPFDKLRDSKPIRFETESVKSVSVRRASGDTVEFSKKDGIWNASIGEKTISIDQVEFEQALAQLGSMSVARFVDEPEGPIAVYGLKEPRAVVTVHFNSSPDNQSKEDLVFYLGEGVSVKPKGEEEDDEPGVSAKNAVYAKLIGDPTIYELKNAPLNYLTRSTLDYRDKEPLRGIKINDVSSITVGKKSNPPIVLQRKDEKWVLLDGDTEVPAEQERIATWIASIFASRVLSYQESSSLKKGEEDYIALKLIDGKEIRISFGGELGVGGDKKTAKEGERPRWVHFDLGDPKSSTYAVLPAQKIADILRERDYFKAGAVIVESEQ
jgi:hypothetical protein